MNEWEKFNETSLPKKEELHSNLNMEDVTNVDYMHAKGVCKEFKIKNLGKYYVLYLKSSVPGLARQAILKKTEVKIRIIN